MSVIDTKFKPNLFNIFPRSMGTPGNRVIVYNSKERDAYINEWGNTHPIYISVYPFKKIIEDDFHQTHQYAKVTHMVCDFDELNAYGDAMRMHNWLMERDIMHRIHLSGRGFHIYFFIDDKLNYPKVAISNFWDYLHGLKNKEYINPFNTKKKYKSPKFNICKSTRGDLGRIIRYPNSYHYKMKCFCIVIDDYIINKFTSIEEFRAFAVKPYKPKGKIYFGSKKLDISEFDCDKDQYANADTATLRMAYTSRGDIAINENVNVDLDGLPFCIHHMIFNEKLSFLYRNEVIKFFVNQMETILPYNIEDLMGIMLKISKVNPWIDWFFKHNREDILYRNIRVVYDNVEILNGCNKIRGLGLCNRIECEWKNITEKE